MRGVDFGQFILAAIAADNVGGNYFLFRVAWNLNSRVMDGRRSENSGNAISNIMRDECRRRGVRRSSIEE